MKPETQETIGMILIIVILLGVGFMFGKANCKVMTEECLSGWNESINDVKSCVKFSNSLITINQASFCLNRTFNELHCAVAWESYNDEEWYNE